MKEKKMVLCSNHGEYPVPLVWTFAFNGREYWCPYCGYGQGVWGDGKEVDPTPELEERLRRYKEFSKDFLHAKSVTVCSSLLWNGEHIPPSELPEEEKARLQKLRDEWKYDIKIEDVAALDKEG